jgi:hypothetical protein
MMTTTHIHKIIKNDLEDSPASFNAIAPSPSTSNV